MQHILCSSIRYISIILENLSNGTETDTPTTAKASGRRQ